MKPYEIIEKRADCYKERKPEEIYGFYSDQSEFKKVFKIFDVFNENFVNITDKQEHMGVKIVSETVKGNLAEVKFIEYFQVGSELLSFYSKTVLKLEDGCWKILKEQREVVKG